MSSDDNPFHAMLADLSAHRLEVQLVPLNPNGRGYNEGGCKRVVTNVPPRWYRLFCRQHTSSRGIRRGKFDTRIKRANVLRLLERLATGLPSRSKYADEIRAIGRKQAAA